MNTVYKLELKWWPWLVLLCVFLFYGKPDLHDALISKLTGNPTLEWCERMKEKAKQ